MSLKGVVLGGVVDSDFCGNIAIILTYTSDRIVEIELRDRIVQVFFLKKEYIKFKEVDELDCNERGEKGFGSTGKKKCRKSKLKSLPLVERKFVHISHLVLCDYSVIFIDYDKYLYQDKIQEIVQKIIKESQKSSLY